MCNYNIGYIDDDSSSLDDYSELLEKYVNLKFVENCKTIHDVYLWVLNNKIECFVADFKLSDRYTFSGTELIEYLNKKIPDLVCVILTNYPCDSIAENIVSSILIRDRNSLNKLEDFENFCSELRQASQVFHKRLNNIETSFSVLLEKKRVKSITADEEETFIIVSPEDFGEGIFIDQQIITEGAPLCNIQTIDSFAQKETENIPISL